MSRLNLNATTNRSSRPVVFCKKSVLKNLAKFTGKHLWQSPFFIKKEVLAQVLSCEFYKIFKNTFFYRTPLVVAFAQIYKEMNAVF